MTTTLGALIASGNFTGYRTSTYTSLDADAIEQLLYQRDYGSYSVGSAHEDAFFAAESITTVDIHTWTCTDTGVGLRVLCMNGEAFALSWQTARKSEHEVVLLSQEARDRLAARWEAHRPATENSDRFVDAASLGLPVAGPGEESFGVDEDSPAHALRPSIRGVAQWLTAIEATGGVDAVTSREVLVSCLEGANAQVATDIDTLEAIANIREKGRDPGHAFDDEEKSTIKRLTTIREQIIAPIEARIAQLDAGHP